MKSKSEKVIWWSFELWYPVKYFYSLIKKVWESNFSPSDRQQCYNIYPFLHPTFVSEFGENFISLTFCGNHRVLEQRSNNPVHVRCNINIAGSISKLSNNTTSLLSWYWNESGDACYSEFFKISKTRWFSIRRLELANQRNNKILG